MITIALLIFSILNVVEAKLESIVIALKNPNHPNYKAFNRLEHRWSAIYYLGIVALVTGVSILAVGFTWAAVPVVFSLLVNRRVFFEYALKLFRKRPIKAIEGDQPLDVAVRRMLGANGGYKELFLLVALTVGLYFLILKL